MKKKIFIDGDFSSGVGECEYHCSPTCHPAQTGPDWVYGCTHKAWPQNKHGDFVPIVNCNGKASECDLRGLNLVSHYKRGLHARLRNTREKLKKLEKELEDIERLIK